MLFELFELARAHGNRPFSLYIRQFFTVFSPLISGVGEHKLFLTMEQNPHSIEVVLIGCRGIQTVRQATLGIDVIS